MDPGSPIPLRMMAAKALVPLPPPDMIAALFLLTLDADEKVRATAAESASKLPDRILSSALRDEEVDAVGARLVPRSAGEAGRLRRDAGPQRLHA